MLKRGFARRKEIIFRQSCYVSYGVATSILLLLKSSPIWTCVSFQSREELDLDYFGCSPVLRWVQFYLGSSKLFEESPRTGNGLVTEGPLGTGGSTALET